MGWDIGLWEEAQGIWLDVWILGVIAVGYWMLNWIKRAGDLRAMRRNASRKKHYQEMKIRKRRLLVEAATCPVIDDPKTINPDESNRFLSMRVQNPSAVGTRPN